MSDAAARRQTPEGDDAWRLFDHLEHQAARSTSEFVASRSGTKAPQAWKHLGTCLADLDALASCFFGCSGGDHVPERLVGRVVGSVRAAAHLMRAAYYDEALNSLRTAGEITNMLCLFMLDAGELEEWRGAEARQRYNLLKPGAVRKRLAAAGFPAFLDDTRYDLFSRIAHGNTTDAPQAHNAIGLPLAGNHLQGAGVLLVINEMSTVASLAVLAGSQLIDIAPVRRRAMLTHGTALAEQVGGVRLEELDAMWAHRRETAHG